jgi:ribose 5-phosphate isomerase A
MAPSLDDLKRAAARRAVEFVAGGTVIGLGTGSTVRHLLDALAERLAGGVLTRILAVPTSDDTAAKCRALGIPLTTLDEHPRLSLVIDGADEIGPGLDLIKGMGGALLREKLVVGASQRFVVLADASKRVRKLGTRAPVPVEVVPFGWSVHLPFFAKLGAEAALRRSADRRPFVTDEGHYIVDCRFPRGIADPRALARALKGRSGIVEDGLFLGVVDTAVIAGPGGVRVIER